MARVAFRVDGSATIGGGHITRCLTLADELRERSHEVTFVCAATPQGFENVVREAGYRVALIAERDLREDWRGDLTDTKAALAAEGTIGVVVVDHYGLDARWEREFQGAARVLAIDDLADRPHACQIFLDQTFGETGARYDGLLPSRAVRLFGARYCLLRQAFRSARSGISPGRGDDRLIVHVFFGSADLKNHTLRFSRLLLENFDDPELRVAIGKANPHRAPLQGLRDRFGRRVDVAQDPPNMAEHMAACTVAVGSPGIATWERACLGLPAAYLAISTNQVAVVRSLAARGLCRYLGDADRITDGEFVEGVREFFGNRPQRDAMRETGMAEIDGRGAIRVADALEAALRSNGDPEAGV